MTLNDIKSPRIALVTKTRTQNQGNQALSIAWRDYLAARYPNANVRLVERGPSYLKRYTLAALMRSDDPVSAFEELASHLNAQVPCPWTKDPSCWDVNHDPGQKQVVRFVKLRRALRLRSRMAALNLGVSGYFERLAYLCDADLLVVNPAGEFQRNATDTALAYLLETRCAQLSGKSTAFVNLSFEIENEMLIRIADHVFAKCDVLEFRDIESAEYFARMGGRMKPTVLPDGAVLSEIERPPEQGGKGVALAINALQVRSHGLSERWDGIIEELRQDGHVTLTSNEWTTDHPFWQKYLSDERVSCEGQNLDYAAYARFLALFDVVVSSRLHTCVLGIVAGAPIVPVETGTFKLSGFFNQIGMKDEPIRMGRDNWQQALFDRINTIRADKDARIRTQDSFMMRARTSLREGLDEVFSYNLLQDNQSRLHETV